jgi:competence protein ComEA
MPQLSKPQLALYAAFAVAVLLIGARFLRSDGGANGGAGTGASAAIATPGARSTSSPATTTGANLPPSTDGLLVVDVKGAVHRPGVYRLPAGARALDAVRRAGGLMHRADRVGVNLAARVVDGGEVVVPERGAAGGAGTAPTASGGSAGAGSSASASAPLSLDLDTATVDQLQQLDGVGPATATKIVAYRTQHGGFASIDELDAVPGIGPAKLAAIRAQLGR